jgi:hypothetical protein
MKTFNLTRLAIVDITAKEIVRMLDQLGYFDLHTKEAARSAVKTIYVTASAGVDYHLGLTDADDTVKLVADEFEDFKFAAEGFADEFVERHHKGPAERTLQ